MITNICWGCPYKQEQLPFGFTGGQYYCRPKCENEGICSRVVDMVYKVAERQVIEDVKKACRKIIAG